MFWRCSECRRNETSVFRHDDSHAKDRRTVTNWIVALESRAECNGEPLRGMNKKMTRLSKRTRSTNMWILLHFSSIAIFEFVLNEKVRDLC